MPGCDGVLPPPSCRLRELEAEAAGAALARQQLARLKQQMLTEQDDEEEKVRWRVDAEVKMELERLRRSGEVAEAGSEALDAARAEAAKWQAAAAAREAELANLNHALGECEYEVCLEGVGAVTRRRVHAGMHPASGCRGEPPFSPIGGPKLCAL